MQTYIIYPMVVGSKVFDKGMMTYQHDYGQEYTISIYSWYTQGTDKQILMDTGEMQPIQSESREKAIDGRIVTLEQGLARFGLEPGDIDVVIHTHLHNDQCENDYKCANALFYCHNQELQEENLFPPAQITAMEMEVIPPGTAVNTYQAYDILPDGKKRADILIPLHEPKFAAMEYIG